MAEVKCAQCGVTKGKDDKGWKECADCGATYCPSCLGRMQGEDEKIRALKDDPHRRVLATCPSCAGDLALMDWV